MKYSVITVAWNKLEEVTSQCLPSFYATEAEWEMIIISNGCTDGTGQWLLEQAEEHAFIRPVILKENIGYAGGLNAGLRVATGELIVCMNNDIQCVKHNWLQMLFEPVEEDPNRLVGPRLISDNAMTNLGHGDIPYLEGWMVAAHRDLWDALDGWDASLRPAWFEDVDLSWRAEQAGYELFCNQDVPVLHLFGMTAYRSGLNFHKITKENKHRFAEKYLAAMEKQYLAEV